MVGQDIRDVVDAVAQLRLEPGRGRGMAGGPRSAWQLAVGDVATQDVPEGVLALAGHRALCRRTQEAELRELGQRPCDLAGIPLAHRHQWPVPEDLADNRGIGQQALAVGRERVEARGQQGMDRVRQAGRRRRAA